MGSSESGGSVGMERGEGRWRGRARGREAEEGEMVRRRHEETLLEKWIIRGEGQTCI